MTEKVISHEDLAKALAGLQAIAKGSAGGAAPSTKLASEAGESGATQLFHTAANSDPGTWAGTTAKGEGWEDHVDANGTDMAHAGKAMAKSIEDKLAKGEPLSKNERMFVSKGGMKPAFLGGKDDDKDEKKDDKKVEKSHDDAKEDAKMLAEKVKPEALTKKSLTDYVAENETVAKGIEVSDFLAGFADVTHKSLSSMEARITDRVLTAIAKSAAEGGEVQKSLAEALSTLGEVLSAQATRIEQVETGAARAPKSTLAKGLEAGEAAAGEPLNKSAALGVMFDMVQKNEIPATEVVKYDGTGEMSRATEAKVRRALAKG